MRARFPSVMHVLPPMALQFARLQLDFELMVSIRLMTLADMPTALHLTEQAGWNQKEADWRRFLEVEPCACYAAAWNNRLAGFTVACVFGSVAWIAMVLVDTDFRCQGIATALVQHALAGLENRDVKTVCLDATDKGKGVYESLGFVTDYQVTRYAGTAPALRVHPQVVEADLELLPKLAALDARVAGADRGTYLRRLVAESPHGTRVCYQDGQLAGFVMTRAGTHALQIGPCIASPQAGSLLLEDRVHRCQGQRIYIDVPADHAMAVDAVEAFGLTVQRQFTRMVRGLSPGTERAWLWSSSGPEKG